MKALRFAVIGSPVAHSESPAMHMAAFRAMGLPHTYEKLETSDAELPSRVEALRRGEFAGLNVTVPHKQRVLSLVDRIGPRAQDIGAANTLALGADGAVEAFNTDAAALVAELARLAGDPAAIAGRTGLVLGTGGAARAAIAALAALGVKRVVVLGRGLDDATRRAAIEADAARILAASSPRAALGDTSAVGYELAVGCEVDDDVAAIVQATSCGMTGGAPGEIAADALRWDSVPTSAVALDVVYTPRNTPFLASARARGLRSDDGLRMFARQGALALGYWLGVDPPFDAMLSALE